MLLAVLWGSHDKRLSESYWFRLPLPSNVWLETAKFVYRQDETRIRVKEIVSDAILLSYCKVNLLAI